MLLQMLLILIKSEGHSKNVYQIQTIQCFTALTIHLWIPISYIFQYLALDVKKIGHLLSKVQTHYL